MPPNNTPSYETPDIDIPDLNINMWSAEELAIRNASISRHEPWGQQTKQNNP